MNSQVAIPADIARHFPAFEGGLEIADRFDDSRFEGWSQHMSDLDNEIDALAFAAINGWPTKALLIRKAETADDYSDGSEMEGEALHKLRLGREQVGLLHRTLATWTLRHAEFEVGGPQPIAGADDGAAFELAAAWREGDEVRSVGHYETLDQALAGAIENGLNHRYEIRLAPPHCEECAGRLLTAFRFEGDAYEQCQAALADAVRVFATFEPVESETRDANAIPNL